MNPWESWEDWLAGLYKSRLDAEKVIEAQTLLSSAEQFDEAAREMIRMWPIAALHNLGHLKTGHRSWLGQATACYSVGATSLETRQAWGELSNNAQCAANLVATIIRDDWRKVALNGETLFGY
tara:strand:- start:1278 stop:1646 length:369 start_codon:yes stop_codon:yes gene_type:complete